jgi:hypothetical protein
MQGKDVSESTSSTGARSIKSNCGTVYRSAYTAQSHLSVNGCTVLHTPRSAQRSDGVAHAHAQVHWRNRNDVAVLWSQAYPISHTAVARAYTPYGRNVGKVMLRSAKLAQHYRADRESDPSALWRAERYAALWGSHLHTAPCLSRYYVRQGLVGVVNKGSLNTTSCELQIRVQTS